MMNPPQLYHFNEYDIRLSKNYYFSYISQYLNIPSIKQSL